MVTVARDDFSPCNRGSPRRGTEAESAHRLGRAAAGLVERTDRCPISSVGRALPRRISHPRRDPAHRLPRDPKLLRDLEFRDATLEKNPDPPVTLLIHRTYVRELCGRKSPQEPK